LREIKSAIWVQDGGKKFNVDDLSPGSGRIARDYHVDKLSGDELTMGTENHHSAKKSTTTTA
jgi:hypothetical protein